MYYRPGAEEIEELRADKTSIGYVHSDYNFEFNTQSIEFEKGTRIYLVTDGITDQIGGERQLSHGKKRLKKVLMESMHLKMEEQKDFFWEKFCNYKGGQMQRDDNTMLGIEI
jgi:serine phosphatase RsbU (regulator of sigma subunit)